MEWMKKWHWLLDAIIAIPGLRFSDLKWLAAQRGLNLWDNQLARALSAAAKDDLVQGEGRLGYIPGLMGVCALDYYAATRPRLFPVPRKVPQYCAAGFNVERALEHSAIIYHNRRLHAAVLAAQNNANPFMTCISNNPGLVLRGVLQSSAIAEHLANRYLSDTVKNSFTARRPVTDMPYWPEHWIDRGDGSPPIPIITLGEKTPEMPLHFVIDQMKGVEKALVIVAEGITLESSVDRELRSLALEYLVISQSTTD